MADLADLYFRRRPTEDGGRVATVDEIEQSMQEGGEEEEEYHQSSPLDFDFDSFSPANDSSNPPFLDDYTSCFDFGYADDHDCEYEESNRFFFGGEEDDEQMNFVTDLFGTRDVHVSEDPIWELESDQATSSSPQVIGFALGGLRVVGVDSESDSDELELNSGLINHVEDDTYDSIETTIGNHRSTDFEGAEFEWEEVCDRIQFDDRENLNSLINRIEEISISSEISSSEEDASLIRHIEEDSDQENAEWEVLLAMNNIERNFELENMEENNNVEAPSVDVPEDYIMSMDFNTLFGLGLLSDNETPHKGSPPASKSAVDNLQHIVLTNKEVLEKKAVNCAICKDELTIGENVTAMPCHHMYHGSCILPWLSIRNTCPVCRYELPTDDANYEKRKGERGMIMDDEFPIRYNFEVLPL